MKYDPVERKRLLGAIFAMRQCPDVSAKGGVWNIPAALKASRKPRKLPPAGRGSGALPFPSTTTRRRRPRSGYVIDDGPRNEAPGDADRGVSRRGAGRHDRDVLVPQPGCPEAGGGRSDSGRDRP